MRKSTDEDSAEQRLARAVTALGTAHFVPAALDYLRGAAPFRGCLLTRLDGARPPVHLYDNVREERRAEVVDRYLDGAYLLDPFVMACRTGRACAVLRLEDVAPDRFRQSTYCRQYYNAVRLVDEAAVLIDLPDGRHLFYSLGRLGDERRFSRRDIEALRRALPVFAALNRRHFHSDAYRTASPAEPPRELERALEDFGAGVLTDREREIAILILKGHSTRSVAEVAGIAPGTVKIHRKNLYRKLGIASQSELFSAFLDALARRMPA